MSKADRIASFLLRRLERNATRATWAHAHAAGLLVQQQIVINGISMRRYRHGASVDGLSGLVAQDIVPVGRLIARQRRLDVCGGDLRSDFAEEAVQDLLREGIEVSADELPEELRSRNGKPSTSPQRKAFEDPPSQSLLQVLRSLRVPLSVAEVTVCLLISEAFCKPGLSAELALATLRSSTPFICVRVPIRNFEPVFAMMLRDGTLLGRKFRLRDGLGYSSHDRMHRDRDPLLRSTVLTYTLTHLDGIGQEKTREALAKAERSGAPILVTTESCAPWTSRLKGSADLILDAPVLDVRILSQIISICCSIGTDYVISALRGRNIPTFHLGIDDLALAIRADRPLPDILTRLEVLARENAKIDGDDDEQEENFSERKKKKAGETCTSSSTGSRQEQRMRDGKSAKTNIALIQPKPIKKRKLGRDRPPLLVETLSGYGEAQTWVLNLKEDLSLWKRKRLHWADMSTKLLLSGPPGTGKTTFARAMCNSLGLPLLATSVADWLEPGYLGDVLKRMSAIFEAAQEHRPAILFVDEIDGIGRRDGGGSRHYDDYWISLVNRMLELLDGAIRSEGIIIVGATNRPHVIDPALRRSGRLETHIAIEPPNLDALEGIFAHHLGTDLKNVMATAAKVISIPATTQGET